MGRSKFPGKPSKSVMKERIRVLYKNEIGKSDKEGNKKNGSKYDGCCIPTTTTESGEQQDVKLNPLTDADSANKSAHSLNDPVEKSLKTIDDENGQYKKQSNDVLGQDGETKVLSAGTCAGTSGSLNPSVCITGSTQYPLKDLDKLIKKKTVTFKNILETSDDTLIIKSIHNPLNKGPLVSIMKKECLTSQGYLTRGDVIVRPSRLTEILKNNENIDKTKTLSFRSVQIKRSDLSENAKAHSTQVNQYRSPSKEDKKREFAIRNQNENLEKSEQQSIEDNYSLSLDKWKLQKFRPKSDIFETGDDQIRNEYRKWSPKRKDNAVHNKIILRQPRLHFEPQSETLAKGKQNSLNNANNLNTAITNLCTHSVCGVCNTNVGSKILQNRKYGIIACDACRKFISKITKKTVSSSTNPLNAFKIQCSKRDGECVISSLPKNNVKSFKKIYDERCSACWLRKCIKSFHFPSGHKLRLNAILSENNKSKIDMKSVNKAFDSLHPSSVNTLKYGSESLIQYDYIDNALDGEPTSFNWRLTTSPGGGLMEPVKSHNVEFTSAHNITEPVLDNVLSDMFANSKQSQSAQPLINDGFGTSGGKHSKFNSSSNPNKKSESVLSKSIELQSINTTITPEYPKRQKIDFKGPRVKHVCRSASIALGQQIATFSNEDEKPQKLEQSKSENIAFTNSLLGNIYFSTNQEICSQKSIENVEMLRNQFQNRQKVLKQGLAIKAVETQSEPSNNPCASSETNETVSVKENREFSLGTNKFQFQKSAQKYSGNKNVFMLANRNANSLSKMNFIRITKARNCEKKSKMISIDFWDTYVPAEVSQTGFGLILTEAAPTCALCFLCGSMDLEYLLFCVSCCEPYHSYCIQEEVNSMYAIFKDKTIDDNAENTNNILNQLNWVCPRCTICYTCNMSSGAKIKCQKCKKNYHSTCMGTSKGLLGADRPLICRRCLKCQTCSTTKVSKYVGNQPICMQCFKLRRLDSRCPLCNNLFDSMLDLIILECGICEKLIHVKCEGLTEEQSNLLSNLPENIKFVCTKCSLANDHAKALANEWREAVYEELKAGLLDVLRLLSRSRQANVLKININKTCLCGFQQINKNHHILSFENNKHSNIKEGHKKVNDYVLNNNTGSAKPSKCVCGNVQFPQSKLNHSISLFNVKKKIINGEYVSLFDFNADMNNVIMPLKNDELILAYKEILSEQFSWFQNETKTCTDALEEDMFESCNYSFQLDEVLTEDTNAATKFPELLGKVLSYLKQETDSRVCIFCLKEGDGGILQDSRLLYYGYNLWVHANCALYSNDVYEEFDGTLQNVQNAFNKGRVMKCCLCKWPGASIKCSFKTCSRNYHFQCARKANCEFLSDKAVYCSTHYSKDTQSNILAKEMFTVSRPLYIQSDKCRRKYIEPSKVKFALGSLSVIQLGTISSKFSDTSEAIVPVNFVCTRLYWSCREPWKIVKYSVRTLIQHGSITFANNIENNFTVDHSNSVNLVETGLSQIASWHNTLNHGEKSDTALHHEYGQLGNHRFSTDNDNDTISDACVEEEPQNNSDLLPPEIKDAIFEDLPHDILDGISMLDIFPKLMIYEDLIAIEGKPDMLLNDATENCTLQISDDCTSYSSVKKKDSNHKFSGNAVNNTDDISLPIIHSTCPKHELQRSNSEVFLRNFEGYRSQRSSSVTWGCKFDNTRRYFTKCLSDVGLSETRVYHSNCRKAEDEYDDYKLNSKNNCIYDEGKHLTQIKMDKIKLMQLDGTDDTVIGYISTHLSNSASKTPVKCDRCHCTYRSFDSFQRHLVTCEQISTSESETETSSLTPDASHSTIIFQDETNLQLHRNQLASNQKFPTNISIVSEPNVISPEHIIPQNIYATNTTEYEDGLYPNIIKTGYSNVNKNNISINTCYDENSWQNVTSCGINSKCSDRSKNLKCNCTISNSKANNEQYKVCAKTKQESIVLPETINNKADYNSQGKQGYLQFLNQQLVLNNQYSQKDQQSQQQQFVVIQQSVGNNQPLFIQQVGNQAAIPQNIFPVVLSNNSMQYASIPTSTNSLVQGSILQTDASGNLILSSGLQMLSMPSLQLTSQASPQLFGTFNQPQPLHIGSNQMLIGGTGTMEIMPNANQVLLAAPPVYYGLETIVQNTVMSSQQFVSTAMQGVLSQNASFSATTTQVFQSSKFEPVSDAPSGYVLLNNADGTALLVPQTNLMSGYINTNNVHDYQSNYSQDFGNIPGTHSTTFMQQPQPKNVVPLIPSISEMTNINAEAPLNQIQATVNLDSHISSPKKRTAFTSKVDTLISPKNNALDQNLIHNAAICDIKGSDMEETPMVANDYGNHYNVHLICNDSDIYETQNTTANVNNIKLKNGVLVKPKVNQRYIKRSRVSKNTIMSSKAMFKNIVQKEVELNQSKEAIFKSFINKSKKKTHHNVRNVNSDSRNGPEITDHKCFVARIETPEGYLGPKVSIQNTVLKSNNRSMSESYLMNTNKLPPTTPTASFGSNFNNVSTNIVPPIFQMYSSNNTPSRPTNRVLPMQSIQKPLDRSKLKNLTVKRSSFRDNLNKLIDTTSSDMEMKNKPIPKPNIEQNFDVVKVINPQELALKNMIAPENDISETKANSNCSTDPLNLLQRLPILDNGLELKLANNLNHTIALDDGEKYDQKGSDNLSSKSRLSDENVNKSVIEVSIDAKLQKPNDEAFVQNECLEIVKSAEPSKAEFNCKSPKQLVADQYSSRNAYQKISTCNSKKRPEIDSGTKDSEPHLIYEIQSEDGFSYKSKSAAEVWEKVFEAVQSARRLHGLSSLPIGPFADMCGVQMIGLKTNALKYLIEQLPGTENCTKYTPKYHKNTPSTVGSEYLHQDQEDLLENRYGAVRCEPFSKRSDYDLFSWLASRHRKQPKQIFVQPSDTELIARRCTANLPMAMKYRTLKESCKLNVGVFRSLIHGRGLFCIKDIEAGEMVIEYAGELIRSTLTDKRERFYDSRGIGCYMFKIDDNFVVDATMRGNAARFINHSCEPNCYSKVVDILGHKHIIIFSLRRIVQGEELTYDYKFPFEDVKIPCSCGSKKCRKYLN